MKICPTCGCPLEETNYGRDWCPYCFKVIEEVEEPEESEIKERSYIG